MVLIARILLYLQLILIAAIIGTVIAFSLVILIGTLSGDTGREGALAMGAAGISPIGAIAGAIIGALACWKLVHRMGNKAIMVGGYGLFTLALMSVGGYFLYEELSDGNPYDIANEPTILIEWRLPDTIPHNHIKPVYRHLLRAGYAPYTDGWPLDTEWDEPPGRDEEGKTILRLRGKLRWRQNGRMFQLWRAPSHNDRMSVLLDLEHDPQPGDFGPWKQIPDAPGHAIRTRIAGE